MVPEVGREAISEVRGSIEAMAEFTRRIIENGAETVVLISPHAPLNPTASLPIKHQHSMEILQTSARPEPSLSLIWTTNCSTPLLKLLLKMAIQCWDWTSGMSWIMVRRCHCIFST